MKKQSKENWVKNNNWETPEYLLNYIKREFFNGFDYFDPCPYNPNFEIDWTKIDWGKYTFVNPPYTEKDKAAFVKKSYEEYLKWNVVALLIPAATETQIFFKYIYPYARVFLLEKRIKFKWINTKWEYVTNKTGQSWSALCIFDKNYKPFIKWLRYDEYK